MEKSVRLGRGFIEGIKNNIPLGDLRKIIDQGAEINLRYPDLGLPLEVAINKRAYDIVSLLIEKGVKVEGKHRCMVLLSGDGELFEMLPWDVEFVSEGDLLSAFTDMYITGDLKKAELLINESKIHKEFNKFMVEAFIILLHSGRYDFSFLNLLVESGVDLSKAEVECRVPPPPPAKFNSEMEKEEYYDMEPYLEWLTEYKDLFTVVLTEKKVSVEDQNRMLKILIECGAQIFDFDSVIKKAIDAGIDFSIISNLKEEGGHFTDSINHRQENSLSAVTSPSPIPKPSLAITHFPNLDNIRTEKFAALNDGQNQQKTKLLTQRSFKKEEVPLNFDFHSKVGVSALAITEIIENLSLVRYFCKEMLPCYFFSEAAFNSPLPESDTFWITTHFLFTSTAWYLLKPHNSLSGFIAPILKSAGYATNLNIANHYNKHSESRINKVVAMKDEEVDLLEGCFDEVALSSLSAFSFSIPVALYLTSNIPSFLFFSTASTFASSTLSCAASNSKIIIPQEETFFSNIAPYIANLAVTYYLFPKVCFNPLQPLPDTLIAVKKVSLALNSIAIADQIIKSAIELRGYVFNYLGELLEIDQTNIYNFFENLDTAEPF